MDDAKKIQLATQLEQRTSKLEAYCARDVDNYPGWTFLIQDVTKAYGVCPFLNVTDEEGTRRRLEWLTGHEDKGSTYYNAVASITDDTPLEELEKQLESVRHSIETRVTEVFVEGLMSLDEFRESVNRKREARNQNRKAKEDWNRTLQCMDHAATYMGLDLSKYATIVLGYNIKYKPPAIDPGTLDVAYDRMCTTYAQLQGRLTQRRTARQKAKADAMERLAMLIEDDFQVDQTGKYFKRWGLLTQEKKEERIASYCEWYVRRQRGSTETADAMKRFVLEHLEKKELRVTDIDWNSRHGLIANINILYDKETGTFALAPRAPPILKKKRPSRKREREIFENSRDRELKERANRLLLLEIVKGNPNRESVVDRVSWHLHTRAVRKTTLQSYLCARYDEILEAIKKHPIVPR